MATAKCFLSDRKLAALPVSFAGQVDWLKAKGSDVACQIFDEFGFRHDWVALSEIGAKLFPRVQIQTACSYVRAVVHMLIAEALETKEPQIIYHHGRVCFDMSQLHQART